MSKLDLSGSWLFRHWYPSSDDSKEESVEYTMDAHQEGDHVTLESKGADHKEGYVFVRLTIDGLVATGSWHENARMDGPFGGAMYSGAGQLIISKDKRHMEGMWAGAGMDHKANKPRIYTGRWEFTKL
jgi:hypothetical protein